MECPICQKVVVITGVVMLVLYLTFMLLLDPNNHHLTQCLHSKCLSARYSEEQFF